MAVWLESRQILPKCRLAGTNLRHDERIVDLALVERSFRRAHDLAHIGPFEGMDRQSVRMGEGDDQNEIRNRYRPSTDKLPPPPRPCTLTYSR